MRKIACAFTHHQAQKGKLWLVANYSKKIPDTASRYGIGELELCGLVANISAFKHTQKYKFYCLY